ncbi:unnamed protein product [Schistosoma curassoni]|nr:unnamed protein product [Schistosoma curassoni]
MNGTIYISLPIRIIITTEGIFGIILNIVAITVVFTSQFGSKFTTFVFRAQPIFDLSACFSTAMYYMIQSISPGNNGTGIYIIDVIICHFWFKNGLFWLPCILSVQNLVCISLDRASSVLFLGSFKTYTNKFFVLYFLYMLSMFLILYIPTPLLRRYTDGQCVMDFSFPWIQTKVFLGYIVYSWVVFSYFVPVLVTLVSHAWIIHVLKISNPSHQNCATQNFEATLQIQKKTTQLVITTTIMSCQLAILHSFECISQILIACEVVVYTYGTPIEQMGTILISLGCTLNPCILIFSTAPLRKRLLTSVKSVTERISSIATIGKHTESLMQ